MSKYIGGIEKPNYSTICKRAKMETCDLPIASSLKKNRNLTIILDSSTEISIMNQKSLKVQLWKATKVYRRVFFRQDEKGKILDVTIS
jgi:frataxin-like iron-binding protein CyaY